MVKGEFEYGGGEEEGGVFEVMAEVEVGEGRREVVDWVVEKVAKGEVG